MVNLKLKNMNVLFLISIVPLSFVSLNIYNYLSQKSLYQVWEYHVQRIERKFIVNKEEQNLLNQMLNILDTFHPSPWKEFMLYRWKKQITNRILKIIN